jgi:tetratricopeptide (TPR) repeat protein
VRFTIGASYDSPYRALSIAQLREAIRLYRQIYGPENLKLAKAMSMLALRVEKPESVQFLREAIAIQRKAGAEPGDLAASLCRLSYRLSGLEAEQAAREAVAILPDDEGPLGYLAVALRREGRLAEAEPLYLRALADARRLKGENHPRVWILTGHLAQLRVDQKRYAEAESLYRQALEFGLKTYHPSHWFVLWGMRNLGGLYKAQGKWADAEAQYRQALGIARKFLGDDDIHTHDIAAELAAVLRRQGKMNEAMEMPLEANDKTGVEVK